MMKEESIKKTQLPDLLVRLKEALARFDEVRGFL